LFGPTIDGELLQFIFKKKKLVLGEGLLELLLPRGFGYSLLFWGMLELLHFRDFGCLFFILMVPS
jgi:hypothetical protein